MLDAGNRKHPHPVAYEGQRRGSVRIRSGSVDGWWSADRNTVTYDGTDGTDATTGRHGTGYKVQEWNEPYWKSRLSFETALSFTSARQVWISPNSAAYAAVQLSNHSRREDAEDLVLEYSLPARWSVPHPLSATGPGRTVAMVARWHSVRFGINSAGLRLAQARCRSGLLGLVSWPSLSLAPTPSRGWYDGLAWSPTGRPGR